MSFEILVPIGAVVFILASLLGVIYYSLAFAPKSITEAEAAAWQHEPIIDDDMAYLVFSVYPYHEHVHFPALPVNSTQSRERQAAHGYSTLAGLPLALDRTEATQAA